jgi:hypothetical protein
MARQNATSKMITMVTQAVKCLETTFALAIAENPIALNN